MKNNKLKKIIKLKKKIKKFSYYYFNKNKNIIEDEKYDLLIKKFKKLIKKHNINYNIKNIYYKIDKNFKKEKHNKPMLSINSVYTFDKLNKFIKKINKKYKKQKFCCELKIDGIALSLIYKKNKLYKSITRGDGKYGENITENIKQIKSIPKLINNKKKIKKIEIRGELFIKKKKFIKLNKKKRFSNCRNFVSGSIKLLNKKKIKKRKLSFIGYELIINNKKNKIKYQIKDLKKIKKFGFKISKYTSICKNIKQIKKYFNKIKKKRKYLDFDIDGIVIKINNKNIQNIIKNNNNYFKWCISIKFSSKKKITKVKKIKFNIGKSGIIVPLAIVKPIYINGIKIKKINLYNIKYYNKIKIKKYDKILIEYKGDVIPKIIKIIKRSKKKKFIKIKYCPSCKHKINNKVNIPKCNNINCINKIIQNINNFISKKGFNIKGIGLKTIKILIKKKIIKSTIDILKLNKKKIKNIFNFKEKKIKNIIRSIKKSLKNVKLKNVIYSLSIPKIGFINSKKISKKIKKLKNFIYFNNYKKKNKIINKKKIKEIKKYLKIKKNILYIKKIKNIINKNNNNI